jgi:chromosome partitioning protein
LAKVIAFGIQKGGVGKTTTTAITAWLLAKTYKVLAIDFDSQGNLTAMLTMKNIYDFENKTALEMMKEKDPRPYIYEVSENLHVIPANDFLAQLPLYLHRQYKGNPYIVLKEALEVVQDQYDFILIDCPPNLGDHTVNACCAADYAVALLQSEPFCLDALERYLEFLSEAVKAKVNPNLQLAGVLTTMVDSRAALDASIIDVAKEDYEDLVFGVTIKRRTRIKEFSTNGISDRTKQDQEALEQYNMFVQELLDRVKG